MIIVVTCWALLQVVQREYIARGATTGPDLPVEFESNSISLQLPTEGITLEDGWRIIPLFNPEVRNVNQLLVCISD